MFAGNDVDAIWMEQWPIGWLMDCVGEHTSIIPRGT